MEQMNDSSTWDMGVGGAKAQGHPWLYPESEGSPGYMTLPSINQSINKLILHGAHGCEYIHNYI